MLKGDELEVELVEMSPLMIGVIQVWAQPVGKINLKQSFERPKQNLALLVLIFCLKARLLKRVAKLSSPLVKPCTTVLIASMLKLRAALITTYNLICHVSASA